MLKLSFLVKKPDFHIFLRLVWENNQFENFSQKAWFYCFLNLEKLWIINSQTGPNRTIFTSLRIQFPCPEILTTQGITLSLRNNNQFENFGQRYFFISKLEISFLKTAVKIIKNFYQCLPVINMQSVININHFLYRQFCIFFRIL